MFVAVKVVQGDNVIYYGNNDGQSLFIRDSKIKETDKIEVAIKDFLARLKGNEDVG